MSSSRKMAVQLYSLRTILPAQLETTLRDLARMGYRGVEFAGLYDRSAADLRKLLDASGLQCAGAHVPMKSLTEETAAATARDYLTLGTDRLIVPWASMDDLPAVLTELQAIHARARAAGCRAGYHNHAHEFTPIKDSHAFDRIFAATPKDFLVQLDIGWAVAARQDVPAILARYADRIETVHLKEFKKDVPTAVLGEGEADWATIFKSLKKLPRLEWLIVEQEQHAGDPLKSVERCLTFALNHLG